MKILSLTFALLLCSILSSPAPILIRKVSSGAALPTTNLIHRWVADTDVFSDAGSTAATNTDDVQEWHDQVGAANFTQTTAADKPNFQTNIQNGLPGIYFDGANTEWMSVGSAVLTTSSDPWTVYVVYSVDTIGAAQTLFASVYNGDPSHYWAVFQNGSGTVAGTARDGGSSFSAATTTSATGTQTHLACYVEEAGNAGRRAYLDGAGEGTESTTTAPASPNRTSIGYLIDSSPSTPLTGYIHEILIYSADHDATARDAVEAYIDAKWALTGL